MTSFPAQACIFLHLPPPLLRTNLYLLNLLYISRMKMQEKPVFHFRCGKDIVSCFFLIEIVDKVRYTV